MFIWLNEEDAYPVMINVEQIVRIAQHRASDCLVHLADGEKIVVKHSIDSIGKLLQQVTKFPVLAPR
jgi:uncharacterized protein YlzI (FlbEa/FlbD family)